MIQQLRSENVSKVREMFAHLLFMIETAATHISLAWLSTNEKFDLLTYKIFKLYEQLWPTISSPKFLAEV